MLDSTADRVTGQRRLHAAEARIAELESALRATLNTGLAILDIKSPTRFPGAGMAALLADVRAFHQVAGVPVCTVPAFPAADRVDLRNRLLREEFTDYCDGVTARNIVEVADALADMVYIICGTALEFGIPLERVWAEVQRSNMAKVDPATGACRTRSEGKILKPEGMDAAGCCGGDRSRLVVVYVDDMRAPFRGMLMCHMVADTLDELHAMADRLGVRQWFQDTLSGPHYDIALSKRALAVQYGARQITLRQCALMCSNARVLGHLGDPATAEALWRALREVRQRAREGAT